MSHCFSSASCRFPLRRRLEDAYDAIGRAADASFGDVGMKRRSAPISRHARLQRAMIRWR